MNLLLLSGNINFFQRGGEGKKGRSTVKKFFQRGGEGKKRTKQFNIFFRGGERVKKGQSSLKFFSEGERAKKAEAQFFLKKYIFRGGRGYNYYT